MSRIIYPGSYKENGPWIMDKEGLASFENMVNRVADEQSMATKKKYIPQHIVTLENGQKIVANSLSELELSNDLKTHYVTKLHTKIDEENRYIFCTEFTFQLGNRALHSFQYDIRDIGDESVKLRCINIVDEWVNENRPSFLLRLWNSIHSAVFFLGLFVAFFILATATSDTPHETTCQQELLDSAYEIIEQGVNEENVYLALQILLEKEFSDVSLSIQPKVPTVDFWIGFVCICVVTLVVAFCPIAHIAIGIGKQKVKFWKGYIKILTYFIPTAIILPLLINFVSSIIT